MRDVCGNPFQSRSTSSQRFCGVYAGFLGEVKHRQIEMVI